MLRVWSTAGKLVQRAARQATTRQMRINGRKAKSKNAGGRRDSTAPFQACNLCPKRIR